MSEIVAAKKPVDPVYQLAANENHGAIIAQVQFNGDNFDEWAQAVRTALRVKKKYSFVDGTVTKPRTDETEYEDWVSASSMVSLWILNTVDPKVRRTLANKEDPQELWKEIKDRFSEGNGPRIQEIKAELAGCRQGNLSVIDYFGKLQIPWDDLTNYEQQIKCTCGACTCNLNAAMEKKKEEDRIHQFLLGLDDHIYGSVRASVISTDPLPNLNQVYSKVKSIEKINTVTRGREAQGGQVAFVERNASMGSRNEDKSKLFCSNCKKTGHTAETCFQLVGFPDWWGERSRQSNRGGGRGTGRGRGAVARANTAVVQSEGESSAEAEKSGFVGLSNEQWKTLIKVLEEKQGTTPRLSGKNLHLDWVLDSGASNHMTGYEDLLCYSKYILPCTIGLPNGEKIIARKKGTVVFDEDFELKNVLFVPDLKCNLISVSQLIADSDLVMQIANKGCVIHDRIRRNLTGAGELKDVIYFFRRITSFNAFRINKDGAEEVWHQRLGHPSNSNFDLLPCVGSRSKDFSTCDTCLRAKQCRESFISSDNKSNDIFDIIHCDLWGPYRTPILCNSYYFLTIVDDHSKGVWVYLLHDKTQVGKMLREFMAMVTRQFGKVVKIVRSDNGTEFTCLAAEFQEKGIIHQTSCVGTPQQNGRVERKHRHLLNVARSLLF
ncbi:Retrovirus-related Pol polyprotein from transposon TNT 1-94 [Cardamine amara subsp. amara]|uniref:Retrovirus-related Pol polyprotein from transposon TNT 1-94 n=1 Tax=Cardamine amara subsp. amara TaxID=228776 RepID=A0ABD1BRQ7_CARAN